MANLYGNGPQNIAGENFQGTVAPQKSMKQHNQQKSKVWADSAGQKCKTVRALNWG